ncbi:MAG: PhoU domain-containing protein, partial [Alphaproteobacteria bacterium]
MDFATNLEHVGDIIDKNLLDAIGKKVKRNLKFSDEGLEELDDMLGRVRDSLRLALNVLLSRDRAQARALLERKEIFRDHERRAQERHYLRLEQGVAASLETSELHLDILRDLTQINAHLTSVAYPILEEAGDLYRSRLRKGRADTSSGD